jgi:hypothetical protein
MRACSTIYLGRLAAGAALLCAASAPLPLHAAPADAPAPAPAPQRWLAAASSAAAAAGSTLAAAGAATADASRAAAAAAAAGAASSAGASRSAAAATLEATAGTLAAASAGAARAGGATADAARAAAAAAAAGAARAGEATTDAARAAAAAAAAGAAATAEATRAVALAVSRAHDFARQQRVVNDAPSDAVQAALARAGFARSASAGSAAWAKPLAIALPLRLPALGGGGGGEAFEEAIVAVGAHETPEGRLVGLLLSVEVPARAFAWSARVGGEAWTTVAVPGLSLDAGGLASAGLLVGTAVVREGGEQGGYAVAVDLLLGVHVIGVDLGKGSRVRLAQLGPFALPRL